MISFFRMNYGLLLLLLPTLVTAQLDCAVVSVNVASELTTIATTLQNSGTPLGYVLGNASRVGVETERTNQLHAYWTDTVEMVQGMVACQPAGLNLPASLTPAVVNDDGISRVVEPMRDVVPREIMLVKLTTVTRRLPFLDRNLEGLCSLFPNNLSILGDLGNILGLARDGCEALISPLLFALANTGEHLGLVEYAMESELETAKVWNAKVHLQYQNATAANVALLLEEGVTTTAISRGGLRRSKPGDRQLQQSYGCLDLGSILPDANVIVVNALNAVSQFESTASAASQTIDRLGFLADFLTPMEELLNRIVLVSSGLPGCLSEISFDSLDGINPPSTTTGDNGLRQVSGQYDTEQLLLIQQARTQIDLLLGDQQHFQNDLEIACQSQPSILEDVCHQLRAAFATHSLVFSLQELQDVLQLVAYRDMAHLQLNQLQHVFATYENVLFLLGEQEATAPGILVDDGL